MNPTYDPGAYRQIRVFVSSTFRDMQKERDILVKRIFPQLRKLCEQRAVTWTEVDLRWGITDEQKAEGKVLPLCLAEIERTRPFFIGLLGERYGWVPDPSEFTPDLLERQPWLKEHVDGQSVTELEILHGVLRNPSMAHHAYFYFRDPAYVISVPEAEREELLERPIPFEVERYGQAEAERRTERRKARLAAIKQQILKGDFPVETAYPNPEELGECVLRDFRQLIDRLYPETAVPDAIDRERQAHEAYGRNRALAFVPRPSYSAQLDTYVAGEDPDPFVVLGESGGGKSALLADWAERYRKAHPDEFRLIHFIGSTPGSANWMQLLQRIMGELKKTFTIADEIPADPDKVREAFSSWLVRVATRDRIILVLDALNQLEDRNNAPDLGWLPARYPRSIRLIISTLPGRALEAIRNRGWIVPQRSMKLEPFTVTERLDAIRAYLEIYRKDLGTTRTERLAGAPQAGNALFLRAVLDELRQFGSHELLDLQLKEYLAAPDVPGLFVKILSRWKRDFDGDSNLVSDSMSLLWASRNGLSETELLEILQESNPSLTRRVWSPFYLAAEGSIVNRGGLLNLGHPYLRSAVETAYLPSEEQIRGVRMRLASYFTRTDEPTDRKLDELPWLLFENRDWDGLKDVLTDIPTFLAMRVERRKWELHGYWLLLGERHDAAESYQDSLERWISAVGANNPATSQVLNDIAGFHQDRAEYKSAEPLLRRALETRERVLGMEHPDTLSSVNNLALLLSDKGDYSGAELLFRRVLEARERLLGMEHSDTLSSVNNLAHLLESKGDYTGAEPLYRRALEARERVLGMEHPDTLSSVNFLRGLLENKGDYAGAEPLFRRAHEANRRGLGMDHPLTLISANNLALDLLREGDYVGAELLFRRVIEASERFLGLEHPSTLTYVNNLAYLLESKGDYTGAELLFRRALEARECVLGMEHPDTLSSVNSLAHLLESKGDHAGAEPLYRRALEASERVLGMEHPYTLAIVFNLAQMLRDAGNHGESAKLYSRILSIGEQMMSRSDALPSSLLSQIATSHNNLAFHTHVPAKEWAEAELHYQKSMGLFQQLGTQVEAADVELNLQNLYHLCGRPVDIARVRELTRVLEEVGDRRAEKGQLLLREIADRETGYSTPE